MCLYRSRLPFLWFQDVTGIKILFVFASWDISGAKENHKIINSTSVTHFHFLKHWSSHVFNWWYLKRKRHRIGQKLLSVYFLPIAIKDSHETFRIRQTVDSVKRCYKFVLRFFPLRVFDAARVKNRQRMRFGLLFDHHFRFYFFNSFFFGLFSYRAIEALWTVKTTKIILRNHFALLRVENKPKPIAGRKFQ